MQTARSGGSRFATMWGQHRHALLHKTQDKTTWQDTRQRSKTQDKATQQGTKHNTARHKRRQHSKTQDKATQQTQYNTTQHCTTQRNTPHRTPSDGNPRHGRGITAIARASVCNAPHPLEDLSERAQGRLVRLSIHLKRRHELSQEELRRQHKRQIGTKIGTKHGI